MLLVKFLDYQTNTLHHINVIPTLLDFKIHVAINFKESGKFHSCKLLISYSGNSKNALHSGQKISFWMFTVELYRAPVRLMICQSLAWKLLPHFVGDIVHVLLLS